MLASQRAELVFSVALLRGITKSSGEGAVGGSGVNRGRRRGSGELMVVAAKVPRGVVYRLRRAYSNLSALIRHLLEKEASKLEPNGGTAKNSAFFGPKNGGPAGI